MTAILSGGSRLTWPVVTLSLLAWVMPAWSQQKDVDLRMDPEAIEMNLFYDEGHVSVDGTLPAGMDAALIVRGQDEDVEMSMKGRRLHLWMAVGTATFQHAPVFYRCLTSKPIDQMTSPRTATEVGLGFDALKTHIAVHLDDKVAQTADANRDWKAEFLKYKRKTGLYALEEGALTVTAAGSGSEAIHGDVRIPARAPRGEYQVTLIGFKDGKPAARASKPLTVSLVGTVAFLQDLALTHGWWYGVMAVLVALAAGLGVGFLMPSKGGGRAH